MITTPHLSKTLTSWEEIYISSQHLSVWPWTEVISLFHRFCRSLPRPFRVLELGCGAGANIPFFKSLSAEYWGIEGSPTIVERLKTTYPDYADQIYAGDFTKDFPGDQKFHLILDRGSITHNPTSSIRNVLELIKTRLENDGYFLGIDWFSSEFDEYHNGQPGEDQFTRLDFKNGKLAGTGLAHFCDKDHLTDLLSAFTLIHLEHKRVEQHVPENWDRNGGRFAAWNFVAQNRV